MDIVSIVLTIVNRNTGECNHVTHNFWKSKDFNFCMSCHTIEMLLDDVKMTIDDIQIQDDIIYNIYNKTLFITAKYIR